MRLAPAILLGLALYLGFHGAALLERRRAYLESGLGPVGGGNVFKDLVAYAVLSLPRVVRVVTMSDINARDHADALEGYHHKLQFNQLGGASVKLMDSPHYAENFYFWASQPRNQTDFILSTRLSFFGPGGSHVVPWFSFSYKGEAWNLPDEFEDKCAPHNHTTDPRVARAPGLGDLYFEVLEPLKSWKLSYRGLVQNENTGAREHVDAVFHLEFRNTDVFFYQVMWDELSAALAMSSKAWSAQFWKDLRSQNQERYASRTKSARGEIVFTKTKQVIALPELMSSRDHNWGIRDWLYIYRYLWWSPIHFAEPIVIEGVPYTYFLGSFVEYGLTFSDLIVGGLMSDDGKCASFSGSTPLKDIAPEWFRASSSRGKGIGEALVPKKHKMTFGLLHSRYALDVEILHRGAPLWSHSFMLIGGDFEIHEAQTLFSISLRKMGSTEVLAKTTAQGLWEFGAPLVKGSWL